MSAMNGKVVSIHVRPTPGQPTRRVTEVAATPDTGLAGDHARQSVPAKGKTFQPRHEVTLIESEALEAIRRESSIDLPPEQSRRNIITRGVALNHLIGCEFRIGGATLRGVDLCEPCSHLEGLTIKGVCAALVHRGGLRAQVVTGGVIRTGDAIVAAETIAART